MKCPICKNIDENNILIEHSENHEGEYKYFYCVYSCDAFTIESKTLLEMKNHNFNDREKDVLMKIALERVINMTDIEELKK